MAHHLKVLEKPGYLHFIATGDNIPEDILGYLKEGLALCEGLKVKRILVEERLEGSRLGLLEIFPIAVEMAWRARSILEEVAFVEVNAENGLSNFAGKLAQARGLGIRVFDTVAEAERWLNRTDRGGPG
jgi:hypothetical protein